MKTTQRINGVNRIVADFLAKGPKNMLIDGKWVPSISGRTFETVNPATEDVLTSIAEADKEDVNIAVQAARRACENSDWKEGATLATGGFSVPGRGYFMQPTVFTNVKNNMRLAREEIFGPVVVLIPFKDENDAVLQSNDSEFGLAACVWTKDISMAHRIAGKLKAGTVWINTIFEMDPIFPFGGYKQSGLGRELGTESIDGYTQIKSVVVRY